MDLIKTKRDTDDEIIKRKLEQQKREREALNFEEQGSVQPKIDILADGPTSGKADI